VFQTIVEWQQLSQTAAVRRIKLNFRSGALTLGYFRSGFPEGLRKVACRFEERNMALPQTRWWARL
jgi:hypothetical protein